MFSAAYMEGSLPEGVGPNIGTEGADFFQTDADLAKAKAREEAEQVALGDSRVFVLPSKVLAMQLVKSPIGNPAGTPLRAYVGESGHVARQLDLTNRKVLRTYAGHSGPVTCVAIIYNLKTGVDEFLLTGSWDTTIKKYNTETKECLFTFTGHGDFVKELCILQPTSLNADLLFYSASSDSTIKKWNANTGALAGTLNGHSRGVECIILSQDETHLYSASSDTTIRKWDTATGASLHTFTGHVTSVYGLHIDDSNLWSASADRTAKRWDLEMLTEDTTLTHPDFVRCVLPVAGYAITGSRDDIIRVWNVSTGRLINTLIGHFDQVSALALHGDILWTGSLDRTVRCWNVKEQVIVVNDKVASAALVETVLVDESHLIPPKPKSLMTEDEERELAALMEED